MANSSGSDAKSNSRRCFTLVSVTTPTVPSTPLPTKFAVAEKHMDSFLPCEPYNLSLWNAKYFLELGRKKSAYNHWEAREVRRRGVGHRWFSAKQSGDPRWCPTLRLPL